MKKLFLALIFTFILIPVTAFASPQFDEVLSGKIKELGIFDGKKGIVYSDIKNFENRDSLLIVYITESAIVCDVYDNSDGIQLTDTLEFPYGGENSYKLGLAEYEKKYWLVFSTTAASKTTNEFFTIQNDNFIKTDKVEYNTISYIAGYEKGKIISYQPSKNVSDFLNNLKKDIISKYPFENQTGIISSAEKDNIKTLLTACADIMSFDIRDYDYDTLFKYILYTHKNFQIVTNIPASSGNSSSLGYNNVSIVSSDFIDFIVGNIFRIVPEKPPVNTLLSRGFCYNNGFYYYTGGFDAYFATKILDIIGIYNIDNENIFVVFSDIYYENNTETPEYSFAVLHRENGSYSMLRLGMGESLPSYEEIMNYTQEGLAPTPIPDGAKAAHSAASMPILISLISGGIIVFTLGIIALIKLVRK